MCVYICNCIYYMCILYIHTIFPFNHINKKPTSSIKTFSRTTQGPRGPTTAASGTDGQNNRNVSKISLTVCWVVLFYHLFMFRNLPYSFESEVNPWIHSVPVLFCFMCIYLFFLLLLQYVNIKPIHLQNDFFFNCNEQKKYLQCKCHNINENKIITFFMNAWWLVVHDGP